MDRDFELDLIFGDVGLNIAQKYLESSSRVYALEDVSADDDFKTKGVDLTWRVMDFEEDDYGFWGEVKLDLKGHVTGNCFIEIVSSVRQGTPGWMHYTQADRLLYVMFGEKKLYDLDMRQVLNHVRANQWSYPVGHATTPLPGGGSYKTRGLLVPRDELLQMTSNWQHRGIEEFL